MKKSQKYRVYLEECYNRYGNVDVPAGWYQWRAINSYLHGRVECKKHACVLSREEAIEIVQDARNYGYEAKAVPPITVVF